MLQLKYPQSVLRGGGVAVWSVIIHTQTLRNMFKLKYACDAESVIAAWLPKSITFWQDGAGNKLPDFMQMLQV